jgi:hypothetical protein
MDAIDFLFLVLFAEAVAWAMWIVFCKFVHEEPVI